MTTPELQRLSHEVAREQVAYWKACGWEVKDAAAVLNIRHAITGWRDIEGALAARWRRLPQPMSALRCAA